jgi:hypothetical protein
MYLARHVGRWSTTVIGRFYNGHDHSTVCYGIQRIEALRESDPDIVALITDLKNELRICGDSPVSKTGTKPPASVNLGRCDLQALADLIADRVEFQERILQWRSSKEELSTILGCPTDTLADSVAGPICVTELMSFVDYDQIPRDGL